MGEMTKLEAKADRAVEPRCGVHRDLRTWAPDVPVSESAPCVGTNKIGTVCGGLTRGRTYVDPAPSAGLVAGRFPPQAGDVWRWNLTEWEFNGEEERGEWLARLINGGGYVRCLPGEAFLKGEYAGGAVVFVRYGTPPAVEAPRANPVHGHACGMHVAFVPDCVSCKHNTAMVCPVTCVPPGIVGHLDADSVPGKDGDPVATWTDQSGNGHHLVAPKPATTRDTYASLRAKLLHEENVRLCPCGEPATTHSGKCVACSWAVGKDIARHSMLDRKLDFERKPEPWVCDPWLDLPDA